LFYWDAASTEVDNGGTIIQATAITTGRWKRVFSGAVNVKWFGAKGDGVADDTQIVADTIIGFDSVYFPSGIYKASINNRESNKSLYLDNDVVFDGVVCHIAIGFGPGVDGFIEGTDTIIIVENINIYGVLKTTGRVGSYYCKNINFHDGIEIVEDNPIYTVQTAEGGSVGVHFYTGTQELYCTKIITRSSKNTGDYGLGIDAFTDAEEGQVKHIYIEEVIVKTSKRIGVQLKNLNYVHINKITVLSYAENATSTYRGVEIFNVNDSFISEIIVDGVNAPTGYNIDNIYIGGCSNSEISKMKSINSPFRGVILVNVYNYTFGSYVVSGKKNSNLKIGFLEVSESQSSGLFVFDGDIEIETLISKNNNQLQDINFYNVACADVQSLSVNKMLIEDDLRISTALNIYNSQSIFINLLKVVNALTYCVRINLSQSITINSAILNNASNNLRYENSSNITISQLISNGSTTRDVANLTSTGVKLGYTQNLVFFQNPMEAVGFVKLGNKYAGSIPTTGASNKGDIVLNNNPTVGGNEGWVCITSGTPGTWKTYGIVGSSKPIQNTANPYLTEAAMHADQANQLEGYGYLVTGAGAFTYLGTVAGTAADYRAFVSGATGTFTSADSKTVTVTNGLITSIV